jgi:hypothetical protein
VAKIIVAFLVFSFLLTKPALAAVSLTLEPQSAKFYKGLDFLVNVLAAPAGAQTGAITTVLDISPNLLLKDLAAGSFFPYPAGTEMLALGISCVRDADCRTLADGVRCDLATSRCVNNYYSPNTATKIRFDLGAACEVAGTSCYPPTTDGVLATLRLQPNKVGVFSLGFNGETQAAVLGNDTDVANPGEPITINVLPQCSQIDWDANGKIDIKDIQTVAGRWNTADTAYDLDESGLINIKDIQYVSSRWGEFCI